MLYTGINYWNETIASEGKLGQKWENRPAKRTARHQSNRVFIFAMLILKFTERTVHHYMSPHVFNRSTISVPYKKPPRATVQRQNRRYKNMRMKIPFPSINTMYYKYKKKKNYTTWHVTISIESLTISVKSPNTKNVINFCLQTITSSFIIWNYETCFNTHNQRKIRLSRILCVCVNVCGKTKECTIVIVEHHINLFKMLTQQKHRQAYKHTLYLGHTEIVVK